MCIQISVVVYPRQHNLLVRLHFYPTILHFQPERRIINRRQHTLTVRRILYGNTHIQIAQRYIPRRRMHENKRPIAPRTVLYLRFQHRVAPVYHQICLPDIQQPFHAHLPDREALPLAQIELVLALQPDHTTGFFRFKQLFQFIHCCSPLLRFYSDMDSFRISSRDRNPS